MKRCCAVLLLMSATAMSAALTSGEKKAHAIARDALPKILAAQMNLKAALEHQDMSAFASRFEKPLIAMQADWLPHSYQRLGITDQEMIMVSACGVAVTDLLQYGQALVREGDAKWASYRMKRYDESIADCKRAVANPEPFR